MEAVSDALASGAASSFRPKGRGRVQTLVEPYGRALTAGLAPKHPNVHLPISALLQRASGTSTRNSQSIGARRQLASHP